ncbi:DoxX family protein [Pseudooceanicola sp. CBS1P-1]|uniref:DoxX family membrane protein n=1 Tax=Pseudooceanicola albus TaxID=2692189 RepID=A0A6L7G8L1_9RHOB|nr:MULTISPECIES: DoxX family protein [Pseudooceanicola]MBT9384404.1 DoxX family protein [Pseudooceanicola endophyticus]MXN19858.1 DoxX family membrane protein [Pseudooceanicola albus]
MTTQTNRPALLIPALAPVYAVAAPLAQLWMRVMCGAALMMHGWPKITNPLGATDMVAGIGFAPAWAWSVALSVTEFGGGLLLLLGLATRFAAAGVTVILLTTVLFHWSLLGQGYKGAELSLIWSAVTIYFVANGGGRFALDRLLKREL